jgi:hypothetical protein
MLDFGTVTSVFLKIMMIFFISEIRNPKSAIVGNPSYS